MFDDEALAAPPSALAASYGARSSVLHWCDADDGAEIFSHNGYYSEQQFADYSENLADADLWASAVVRAGTNRVWNCDSLISRADYERSSIYNEWNRRMGDDTLHCVGTVVKTRWGSGCVALHRGKTQGAFAQDTVRALTQDVMHLRKMLAARARLAAATRRADEAEAVLDVIGDALITVTSEARVLHTNAAADALLGRMEALRVIRGSLSAATPGADRELKAAIARAGCPNEAAASAVSVWCPMGRRYDLTMVGLNDAPAPRHVLISIRDPRHVDGSIAQRLRSLYGLSLAEAQVTVRLAEGAGPCDIASERGVALATVRSQFKTVYGKLGCNRQTEIAALVLRLPPLR